MGYLCREHKHRSTGKCRRKQSGQVWWYTWDSRTQKAEAVAISSVATSVDYVGDPVQNKNKTSKPATLFFSVGVAADKLSKYHRWQHGT